MKKHLFFLLVFLCPIIVFSQNVGVGTSDPLMKLHVTQTDSSVLLLENTEALGIGVNTSMYFKTGNGLLPFTGGIKTIGTGTGTARMGLFTYAATSPNGLLERMSILDNGNVGIGLTSPSEKLQVNGNVDVVGEIKTDSMEVKSFLELSGYNYLGGSDDGVIMSNPNKTGSDIFLVAMVLLYLNLIKTIITTEALR